MLIGEETLYLKANSLHSFQHPLGKNGKIIGTEMVQPKGLEPRMCYKLYWEDSDMPEGYMVDYVPFSSVDAGDYIIVNTER